MERVDVDVDEDADSGLRYSFLVFDRPEPGSRRPETPVLRGARTGFIPACDFPAFDLGDWWEVERVDVDDDADSGLRYSFPVFDRPEPGSRRPE